MVSETQQNCSAKRKRPARVACAGRLGIAEFVYIFSMIALPNSEHFKSFAPVIRRSKS